MNPQLDQQAVNLAKSIRRAETGTTTDPYNAKGKSGESGAYQFMPDTWKAWAGQYLGNPNAQMSVENQNKVAYSRIKELKDQGLTPAQIASSWNSGDPDAYKRNHVGINSQNVAYDTPAYVKKVSDYYREISNTNPTFATNQIKTLENREEQPEEPQLPYAEQKPMMGVGDFLGGLIKEPIKQLLVKPADRVAEAIGRTGILGQDIKKGYEQMADEGEGRTFAGITVEPQKAFGEGGARQIAGDALKDASYLYGAGKAPGLVEGGFKGLLRKGIFEGAKTGGITGGLYSTGEALQHDENTLKDILEQGAIGTAIGTGTGGVLGGASAGLAPIFNRQNFVQNMIKDDVNTLLKNGRAMTNATKLAKQKNVPLEDILSDPEVFRGLKVQNGYIEPDDAIAVLEDRIDRLSEAKGKLLPELDRFTSPVPRETLRQRAHQEISGQMLPADEQQLLQSIDKQIDALPDNITLSELDKFRAKARKSARNARGLQKSDSEYTAIENASRDVLFDATNNLRIDTNNEFAALNNEIKNLIGAQEFIDKTLRGRRAPSAGWAREAVSRIIGGVAGGSHGPLGVILGSEAGRVISNIIANQELGNSFKMRLIREMTDDPAVLKAAQELLEKAQNYDPTKDLLALPAPSSIPVGPAGSTRPQEPLQVIPAPKGTPGRTPKGQPNGGKFFKTYSSGLINVNKNP